MLFSLSLWEVDKPEGLLAMGENLETPLGAAHRMVGIANILCVVGMEVAPDFHRLLMHLHLSILDRRILLNPTGSDLLVQNWV